MLVNVTTINSLNMSKDLRNVCPVVTDTQASKGIKVTVYAIALILSLVGNSLVMTVVFKNRHMRTITNFLIVNLAASDLLLTTFNMPQTIYYVVISPEPMWPHSNWGSFLCKFLPFVQTVSIASSVLSLSVIAVDRFLAIVFPFKRYMSFSVAATSVITLWFVAVVTSSPLLYAMRTKKVSDHGIICEEDWSPVFDANDSTKIYTIVLFTGFYAVPLMSMIILYGIVMWKLWYRRVPGNANTEYQQRAERCKRKALKMLMTVVLVFALCWLPVYITQFLMFFNPHICIPDQFIFVGFFLGHLNSAINPCIYAIFNENFRRSFIDVLYPILFCGRQTQVYPLSRRMAAEDVTCTSGEALRNIRTREM